MSFKVSPRETIRRCDVYDNKFRRPPADVELRLKAARLQAAKDVKEPEHVKAHRELLNKFLAGEFSRENETINIIARFGKVLLVAVMLPPYLVLFGFPKIILVHMVAVTEKTVNYLAKNIPNFSAWNVDVFAIALNRLNKHYKKAKETVEGPFKALNDLLKERFSQVEKSLEEKITYFTQPFSRFFHKVASKTETELVKVRKELDKIFAKADKILSALGHQLSQHTLDPIKLKIAQAIDLTDPVTSFGQKAMKRLNVNSSGRIEEMVETAYKAGEVFKNTAKEMTATAATMAEQLYAKIEPAINFAMPFFPWIYNRAEEGAGSIKDLANKAIGQIAQVYNFTKSVAIWSAAQLRTHTIHTFNKVKGRFLAKRKNIKEWFRKAVSLQIRKGREAFRRKLEKIRGGLKFAKEQTKKTLEWAVRKAKKVPQTALKVVKHIGAQTFSFIVQLGKAFRMLGIFISAFLLHILYTVRDVANKTFKALEN